MIEIKKDYFGYDSKELLIEKIVNFLQETTEFDYKNDWFKNGFPTWTFSGLPNGDILTDFVKEYYNSEIYSSLYFSDEKDRINQCKEIAEEISEEIELI